MSDVDAVVIGAGNAELTAATTLQRAGLRTLLVERHNVPGGCTTSFRRGRYEFEVALHQLSGVGAEGQAFTLRPLPRAPGWRDLRIRPGSHRGLTVPRQRARYPCRRPVPGRLLVRHGRLPAHAGGRTPCRPPPVARQVSLIFREFP